MSNHPVTVGFWPRVWAFVIDTTCLSILLLPLGLLVHGFFSWLRAGSGLVDFLLQFLVPFLLVFWFWRRWLATPGKMLIRSEIVDACSFGPPGNFQLVIRYLGYFVSLIPLGLGMFWIAFDRRHQGWHDKLAGTLVIRSETATFSPLASWVIQGLSVLVAAFMLLGGLALGFGAWSSGPGLLAGYRQLQQAVNSGALQGVMGTTDTCWQAAWNLDPSCGGPLCALQGPFFLRSCLNQAALDPAPCLQVLSKVELSISAWQQRCEELGRSGTQCVLLLGTLSLYCQGLNLPVEGEHRREPVKPQ